MGMKMIDSNAPGTVSPAPSFLNEKQVAHMLCHSVRTIQKWRTTGHGPEYHKLVRYLAADVVAWADARRVSHTSQVAKLSR
jgi:hypothetical protein